MTGSQVRVLFAAPALFHLKWSNASRSHVWAWPNACAIPLNLGSPRPAPKPRFARLRFRNLTLSGPPQPRMRRSRPKTIAVPALHWKKALWRKETICWLTTTRFHNLIVVGLSVLRRVRCARRRQRGGAGPSCERGAGRLDVRGHWPRVRCLCSPRVYLRPPNERKNPRDGIPR